MKFLVVLCLLGLVAAEPQLILPYNAPLLNPTIKTDGGVISTYTATYPNAGFPSIRAALPYNFGYYPYSFPTILGAKPAEDTTGRQKRSADADPAINFPTLATIPTTLNYRYTGLPAAVSTYSVPQTIPYTGVSPIVGTYPYTTGLTPYTTGLTPYTTGLTPYTTGLGPYTANWPFVQPFVGTVKVEAPKEEGVTRAKRSADPEADPQLLTTTTGVTGFTYPAVNTGTVVPSTYTYQNFPFRYPTTYTAGYPFGTLPINTVYG
ncbi:uncharacterized protein [Palaemon carinicauda]|uniref:uncharacterized protein n=1 Tax=Palaemon carinicauda TaxID=392227 RepID=UPI0035B67A5B